MRRFLLGLAILGLTLAAACSTLKNTNESYPQAAKSIAPMKATANIDGSRFQSNYPVPINIVPATGQAPSIIPPNTSLNKLDATQINPQPSLTDSSIATSAQETQTTEPAATTAIIQTTQGITLNIDYAHAWQKTGSSIQRAGYEILDKDESMGSYYILNKQATQGKITKSTPIVQVHLEKIDNQTKVILLNEQNQPLNAALAAEIVQNLKTKGQL